jgi:uncharacterized protein YaaN involved in tellurite resistance
MKTKRVKLHVEILEDLFAENRRLLAQLEVSIEAIYLRLNRIEETLRKCDATANEFSNQGDIPF